MALEREQRLHMQALNFLRNYQFDRWSTAVISQVLPEISLRNPVTSCSKNIIEDLVLDLHHQEIVTQGGSDLDKWRTYVSTLIYTSDNNASLTPMKAGWKIVNTMSAETPNQADLEQAYTYIKANSEQETHRIGTAVEYDTYIDMHFHKLLSAAAYPDYMVRNHNNFMFFLKQHFAQGNPLKKLTKTFIASVLSPSTTPITMHDIAATPAKNHTNLTGPFTFVITPQAVADLQEDLLVAAEEDVHPSKMTRFPEINAGKTFQESGTYKTLNLETFEDKLTNTSGHQLAIVERSLSVTEHLCSVSRTFSFTGIGSNAGFIYVPNSSTKKSIQTLRGFFAAGGTHNIYGGTIRNPWTEIKDIRESTVLEGCGTVAIHSPGEFPNMPAEIKVESLSLPQEISNK